MLAAEDQRVRQDAYVSYRGTRRRTYGDASRPQPLIFVDADLAAIPTVSDAAPMRVQIFRTLPKMLTAQRGGLLLIRPPELHQPVERLVKALREASRHWGIQQPIGVLVQTPGHAARIINVTTGRGLPDAAAWLERARAIELEALLEFGQAIWRPQHYHYRLITGEHADGYVKVADAIRSPRDAMVLASWLLPHAGSKVGVVLDSGTLTPIAQALEIELLRAGVEPMREPQVLDQLTRTSTDVDALIDRATKRYGRLLFVVSISSSNALVGRILSATDRRPSITKNKKPRVEVLVSKNTDNPNPEIVTYWTPLEGDPPLINAGAIDRYGCQLCRTPGRSAVVPINPMTFDAMQPAQLKSLVPSLKDPEDNRPLWEAAARAKAISVESPSSPAMASHRSDTVPMGIKVEIPKMVNDLSFLIALRERMVELADDEGFVAADADTILVPRHEFEQLGAGFAKLVTAVDANKGLLAKKSAAIEPFEADGDFTDELKNVVAASKSILVLGLGTVTGATMQRALVGIQDARKRAGDFRLQGLVLHARPASSMELRTMINSYGREADKPVLHYAFKSVLPDRSPLREEGRLLRLADLTSSSKLTTEAKRFLDQRLLLCDREIDNGEIKYTNNLALPEEADAAAKLQSGPEPPMLLWGARLHDHVLTPNSIYGKDLDEIATYVAVGSAMAARLGEDTIGLPELRVFDMAAMTRSYYDPIIISCFLRWLRPHEAFWGWTSVEAHATAEHMINRAEGRHRVLLVPELLLAAAHGKLTTEAADVVTAHARGMLKDISTPADVRACLEVGLELVKDVRLSPTEGLMAS